MIHRHRSCHSVFTWSTLSYCGNRSQVRPFAWGPLQMHAVRSVLPTECCCAPDFRHVIETILKPANQYNLHKVRSDRQEITLQNKIVHPCSRCTAQHCVHLDAVKQRRSRVANAEPQKAIRKLSTPVCIHRRNCISCFIHSDQTQQLSTSITKLLGICYLNIGISFQQSMMIMLASVCSANLTDKTGCTSKGSCSSC